MTWPDEREALVGLLRAGLGLARVLVEPGVLDRDRRAAPEVDGDLQLVGPERPPRGPGDEGDRPQDAVAALERDDHRRVPAEALDDPEDLVGVGRGPHPLAAEVLQEQRLGAAEDPPDRRLLGRVAGLQLGVAAQEVLLAVAVEDRDLAHATRLVDEVDRHPVGEQRHDEAGQAVERLVDVERRRQRARRLGQEREALAGDALGPVGGGPVAVGLDPLGDVVLDADEVGHHAVARGSG